MDSKDLASQTSSGSSSPSSHVVNSSKNTLDSVDNDDSDTSRTTDGKGNYLSGEEGFETAPDKPAVSPGEEGEGVGEGNSDAPVGGKSKGEECEDEGEIEHVRSGGEDSELKSKQVVDVAAVEFGKSGLGYSTDVKLAPQGDFVVKTSDVDAVGVDQETEGKEDVLNNYDAKDVAEAAIAKPAGSGDTRDSVVDSIQADVLGPGVALVGLKEVHECDETEDPDKEAVWSVDCNSSKAADVNKGDVWEVKPLQSETHAIGEGKDKELGTGDVNTSTESNGFADRSGTVDVEDVIKKSEVDYEPSVVSGPKGNGALDEVVATEPSSAASAEPTAVLDHQEIAKLENEDEEYEMSEEDDTDGMIFGSSEAAKKFIEELEQGFSEDSHAVGDGSFEQSQKIDGQIITDSEEGDTDDDEEGDGKELFDSAALAALLKAATGSDSASGQGTRLFSVERPAGLGSSLRALRPVAQSNRPNLFSSPTLTGSGESEDNLSEEEKKKMEKLEKIRVKFLRLVHRLGLSPEESVAAQVLHRLALIGGRQGTQTYSLDAAKRMALQLESEESDNLDFCVNILVLGKSGVGKSATINSIFGQEKAPIDAFETGTATAKVITGFVDGVKVRIIDTPGLKTSAREQSFNRAILSSVKKLTNRSPTDVFLYVDRLDAQTRDLNDLPLLKTITSALGTSIWRSAVVTLTHAASAPPDGPNGNPLSYEAFVTQRSHVVQQSIGHAVGDLRMMSPSLMNPVSLVENHPSCRKNREGRKILPNGQSWRPQLLLLCYSMRILSEANSISKPQDPFDHRKLFGFRVRSPPLPYMLSSMLQSRPHPKLPSDQGGENADSDIDLDEFSDSDDGEEEDEYDQLPPFKPLKKAQIAKLSKEQRTAYFEEYDYRVKLLQKKLRKEELRRIKDLKKKGKDAVTEEEDADSGAAAPVAVPLPDMALPSSFDSDNPTYRYRFLEPTSQFLARPVLDSHGWDHDCGYDGVNLEHSLAIANRFPVAYTVQITKDKKDFSISLDSSVAVKHGEDMSSMAGFDIQSMGKQLAYILRGETKITSIKKHKVAGGMSITFLGENVVPGVKVEDQITLGKQYVVVGSAGAVRSQHNTAYGANFELQRREVDYPIGQVQSTLSMSIIKWRGDLALGFNSLAQFSLGRNSKVAVRAGINNKLSGQVTVRTSSSEHLSLALAAVIPTAISIYRKLQSGVAGEKYSIY